ncbi:hemerythrin domain-containing protein [Actinomycetospora callitridis]|jgi:hemerythrin superfamily protein|uniref:hemerythrin domain-containing protein n=1 Tax=Actinomycetospora callitridis TaxID=913944 RepID=UPI0023650F75|nr:hemerythrin domain-containing protein [Actinomycetospora callitridis]MDD7918721.1 hemerythrin domain-containing protein [Actinomycetospora callitridis]
MTTASQNRQSTDLIDVLAAEHREVEGLFAELEARFGASGPEVEDIAQRVVTRLVQHSVAEEVHLYPLVREVLDDGDALAEREIAEHDAAERTMKRLEALPARSADFWMTYRILTNLIAQHVGEEEQYLFPRLAAAVAKEDREQIGDRILSTEKTAPTRPHPASPSEGGALAALAPGAGLVDRLRDALTGRGR